MEDRLESREEICQGGKCWPLLISWNNGRRQIRTAELVSTFGMLQLYGRHRQNVTLKLEDRSGRKEKVVQSKVVNIKDATPKLLFGLE